MENVVKIKVHAGGAHEGHVVYTAIDQRTGERDMFSNLQEVRFFCERHNLLMDKEFEKLVLEKLSYSQQDSRFIIPPKYISENLPISSASEYLKKNFEKYLLD